MSSICLFFERTTMTEITDLKGRGSLMLASGQSRRTAFLAAIWLGMVFGSGNDLERMTQQRQNHRQAFFGAAQASRQVHD